MSRSVELIAWIVLGYAVLVTVAAAVGVALRAPRPSWLDQLVWMLELLAVVLALGALGGLATGERPESLATFLGYVATVVVLPAGALAAVRHDRSPWSSGVTAVAALATGVVALRIMMTG